MGADPDDGVLSLPRRIACTHNCVHQTRSYLGRVPAMPVLVVNDLRAGRSLVDRSRLRSAVHLACKVPSTWEV